MPGTAAAEHVGSALRHRRELLAVSLADIINVAGHGHVADVKWIESAIDPSVRRILWHYGWVSQAAELRGTWTEIPYAQRQQWYDTALDEALWTAARQKVGSRHWWWGRGHARGTAGAMCYVCDTWIATYDSGRAMSNPIRAELMAHRSKHSAAGTPAPRHYDVKAA